MVIDGLRVRQEVTRNILQQLNFEIHEALDPISAQKALQFYPFDPITGLTSLQESHKKMKFSAVLIDKDAFGPGGGLNFGKVLLQSIDSKKENGCFLESSLNSGSSWTHQRGNGKDGFSSFGNLKGSFPPKFTLPPFILVGTVLEDIDKVQAKRAGFAELVLKPLRFLALESCLAKIIGFDGQPTNAVQQKAVLRKNLKNLLEGRNVLVVDDNLVNRKVALGFLRRHGVGGGTTAVASGLEAVTSLRGGNHGFHLVLMDLQMPGMDGYEATRRIRAEEASQPLDPTSGQKKRVPIFAISADVVPGSREMCTEVGMNGFIAKPIDEEQLYFVLMGGNS